MTDHLSRKVWLHAKIETTYGVDPGDQSPGTSPIVAGDSMKTVGMTIDRYAGQKIQLVFDRQTLGAYPDLNVSPETIVRLEIYAQGSGVAGTPPAYGPLLRAAGLTQSILSLLSGGVTYTPRSSGYESVTLHHWSNHMRQRV